MASPVVAGTVALMLQANPNADAEPGQGDHPVHRAGLLDYDPLTQGAGFLNTKGAVDLAKFLENPQAGQHYPSHDKWSKTINWGNHKLTQRRASRRRAAPGR